jgi:hypothetical protein
MRWLVGIFVALVAGVGLAAWVQSWPPADAERLAAARNLEAALPALQELGVDGWRDDRGCRALWLDLDEGYATPADDTCTGGRPFTPAAQAGFDRIAAWLVGAVAGGRVRVVSRSEDWTGAAAGAGPTRTTLSFEVAPQVLWGLDSPFGQWTWTWHDQATSSGPRDLDRHWSFDSVEREGSR